MPGPYKVKVTIQSVTQGECPQGFKAGDSWLIEDGKTPCGMCARAYASLAETIQVLRYGGEFPWCENKDVATVSCPDPKRWLIYEVRRLS